MICAISGEVAVEPVVSPVSGRVFEKRLVEKHIKTTGQDPTNGKPLDIDQLINVVADTTLPNPIVPQHASIPQVLLSLQNEWDATMLQTYTLRKQLHETRQQLSQTLYQYDAAKRVIARLVKERDEAMGKVHEAEDTIHETVQISEDDEQISQDGGGMDLDDSGLSQDVLSRFVDYAMTMTGKRKQSWKNVPEEISPPEAFVDYVATSKHPLHGTSKPGITALDMDRIDETRVATGGMDGRVIIFSVQDRKVSVSHRGHQDRINDVCFLSNGTLLSCSADRSIRLWNNDSMLSEIVFDHDPLAACKHPADGYVGVAFAANYWTLFTNSLEQVHTFEGQSNIQAFDIHPDGILVGSGHVGGALSIWDMRSKSIAYSVHHKTSLTSLSFCANGYYCAASDSEGLVNIWDMRKPVLFKEINSNNGVNCVRWSPSGHYLGIGNGTDIDVYWALNMELVKTFAHHKKQVMDITFDKHAESMVSVGMDRKLIFYGM